MQPRDSFSTDRPVAVCEHVVNQSISSESSAAAPEPEKGLPAVQPPSGKHLVQMFVVPAIIVAGFLVILFGIDELRKWFFGVARTPAEHLYNLRSTNPDVRWQAIWALANLGENTNRFDKLSPERQEAVLAELAREAAAGKPEWRERANLALRFLEGRRSGNPPPIGVGATLAACASDDIPFLR